MDRHRLQNRNKYHLSAEQLQAKADEINREFRRFDPEKRHLFQIEIPNTMFTPYLYESQGIEIALSNSEIDTVFWNAAAPGNTSEFIITTSNFMFRKPNKRIFDLALEKAGLQPEDVWYIGDQYECDVKGSLNVGLLPIWYIGAIDLPYTEDKNILAINTWSKIARYTEA